MELVYVAFVRLPTPRAHGLQIMKMCESFARSGARVTLFAPRKRLRGDGSDPFTYYNVERNFRFARIPSTDLLGASHAFGAFFYAIDLVSLLVSMLFVRIPKDAVVYVRDPILLIPFSARHTRVIELHDIRESGLFWRMVRRADRIVAITEGLKHDLVGRGVDASKIIVAPDGVDLKDFTDLPEKHAARRELWLPVERPIVAYTGHFYEWKGADTLAHAARFVPEAQFVFVGGIGEELARFRDRYGLEANISIVPMQPHAHIPRYLAAADVLALPNSKKVRVSARYTSPLKLFEYMAAGRAIVASDLSSIREVLSERNAFLVEPDSPEALAAGVRSALKDGVRALSAKQDAQRYSWGARAQRILGSL